MKKLLVFLFFLVACAENAPKKQIDSGLQDSVRLVSPKVLPREKIADRFDFPVGKPDGKGYYNAQKFGVNLHLGDDWNAVTGGNSDLGDPIYAIANGHVDFAEDVGSGWGNVIRITHHLPSGQKIESLYAHCDTILAQANQWVVIGEQIGTIGTAHGAYLAHLHLELRDSLMPIGGGYSEEQAGYLDPTRFIQNHRE